MKQKIGTFNCEGILTSAAKQQMLVNNFKLYKMSALAVQEKHIKRYGTMKLTSNTGKTYKLYYSGSKNKLENGVGIILPSDVNAEFDVIRERICKVRIKVNIKTVSKALDMSSISRWIGQFADVMGFSTNAFTANKCSVVLLPALYAASEDGVSESSLSTVRFFMHVARTFLIIDRSVIGRRFWTGSFCFPGFCNGVIIPSVNSGGCSPISDMLL